MDISSNYTAALGLPNGQVVPAKGGVTVKSADWDGMKDHPVVKAWLDQKMLVTGNAFEQAKQAEGDRKPSVDDPPPPPDAELDKLSDDELRGYLKDRGVEADGRWGRNRLLTEAEKAKAKG